MRYRVGARGSRLSISQTESVISALKKIHPGHGYEVRAITTKGDTDSRPLFEIDRRGIFAKEIDRAVASGEVDFAVHSLKDVPSGMDRTLQLACVPAREPANDVFISNSGESLGSIPAGSVVGTSSLRRAIQATRMRPDITVRPIRGNIETRIKKASGPDYDGIILAQAGLRRLGLGVPHTVLPLDSFVPSPGQGALALVCRAGDAGTASMLRGIEDPDSRAEAEAERALSDHIGSGCRFPVGAHAMCDGGTLRLWAAAFSADGSKAIRAIRSGPKGDPGAVGRAAGLQLAEQGAADLALNWRAKVAGWNEP